MKKYLAISLISLTLSVVIIFKLYENTDIPIIDAIVESTTQALGINYDVVSKKIERKRNEALKNQTLLPEIKTEPDLPKVVDSVTIDSVNITKPVVQKKLFNSEVDDEAKKLLEAKLFAKLKEDSINQIIKPTEEVKPKRKLFNAQVESSGLKKDDSENLKNTVILSAKVLKPQEIVHNREILFRVTHTVSLGDKTISADVVFTAITYVLRDRISFKLKEINAINVDGENFFNNLPGLPFTEVSKFGSDSYMVSGGKDVIFHINPL